MLQKCSIFDVAGVFFNEPTKDHYLIEISRKANLAHTSVKKYLKILKNKNIIKQRIEKRGSRNFPFFMANINTKEYKEHKKIYNLIKIRQSKLIVYLKDKIMPRSIVLFGSYFKGEDIEDSDIDVFIEANEEILDLSTFEKKLKRKIQLHFKENFNKYPKELKNNIINGIVLHGYLEVFK